jgi:predicted amidohydrolase
MERNRRADDIPQENDFLVKAIMKIMTSQYVLKRLDWKGYVNKISAMVESARQANVDLLMLPEYAGLEIGSDCNNDAALFASIQPLLRDYLELFQQLATQNNLYIQAGTIPVAVAQDKYVNRAYFFGPDGKQGYQDKLQLTRYEKNSELIVRGNEQVLFATTIGVIGIAICYDCEFPEIVRPQVEQGAGLILVPTYTTTVAGYYRVFLSARARALENQCYVATSSIVGMVTLGTESAEATTGQSAILGPVDEGFPQDGIVAKGEMDTESLVVGEVIAEKIQRVRENSEVNNFADYQEFYQQTEHKLAVIKL